MCFSLPLVSLSFSAYIHMYVCMYVYVYIWVCFSLLQLGRDDAAGRPYIYIYIYIYMRECLHPPPPLLSSSSLLLPSSTVRTYGRDDPADSGAAGSLCMYVGMHISIYLSIYLSLFIYYIYICRYMRACVCFAMAARSRRSSRQLGSWGRRWCGSSDTSPWSSAGASYYR
jgi:hypothetical protein